MLPPDVLGEGPVERYSEAAQEARTYGAVTAARDFWLKSPYYALRWHYFHRPSVWGKFSKTGEFDWHGLTGFKTLFAGEGGIGYTGGPRRVTASRFILSGGGRGLELVGSQFTRVSPERVGATISGAFTRVGGVLTRAGGAFRTGGIGGIVGLVHEPTGRRVASLFGGTVVQRFSYESMLAGVSEAERGVISDIARRAGPRAILQPGRLLPPTPSLTDTAARAAASRAVRIGAVANLMKGLTVGLNIALFGGMLANFSYSGVRALGDLANAMRIGSSLQSLEFGGVQPFASAGAYTERQRAIQAIQESHLNARRAIGNEASIMHETFY